MLSTEQSVLFGDVSYNVRCTHWHVNNIIKRTVGIFIFISSENFIALFSKKEFAIVSILRFISRTNFMLS